MCFCFIDYKKAFGVVHWEKLWEFLLQIGVYQTSCVPDICSIQWQLPEIRMAADKIMTILHAVLRKIRQDQMCTYSVREECKIKDIVHWRFVYN